MIKTSFAWELCHIINLIKKSFAIVFFIHISTLFIIELIKNN